MPGTASFETRLRRFADAATLTEELVAEIVAGLEDALRAGGSASLVVSGGRSPVALFEKLSGIELDWRRVWVGLTDERWIVSTSPDSNERQVREHLLRNAAAKASFIGMKNHAPDPAAGAPSSWAALAPLPRPFDYMLLGMGDDGHCASLFPGSPGLERALDPREPPACVGMVAPVAPRERMSLNVGALLDSRRIGLLILGSGKWATYERALEDGPLAEMPVRALLRQRQVPLSVYWAP